METSQGMNPMMMMMAMMNGNGPTNMSDIPPMMGGAMPNMDGNAWANSPNPMPNDMPQGMNPMMMMRMMQGGNGGMPPMMSRPPAGMSHESDGNDDGWHRAISAPKYGRRV